MEAIIIGYRDTRRIRTASDGLSQIARHNACSSIPNSIREKVETFSSPMSLHQKEFFGSWRMVNDGPHQRAIDTAWSVYSATHREVDAVDCRRRLLERHLQRRREAHDGDDELTAFGVAYFEWLPEQDCCGGWRQPSDGWLPTALSRIELFWPFPTSLPELS
jgi:hypothetical protein